MPTVNTRAVAHARFQDRADRLLARIEERNRDLRARLATDQDAVMTLRARNAALRTQMARATWPTPTFR